VIRGGWAPWLAGLGLATLWLVLGTEAALPEEHVGTATWSGDFLSLYLPNAEWAGARIARGELPLWNPQQGVGAPFVGAIQTGVFYPPNLLHALLAPQAAFVALAALHLVLACGLAGGLARRLGADAWGALLAGIGYAGSLQMMSSIWSPPVLYAAAWVPGLFLASDAAVDRPSARAAAALAGTLALALVTGWPYAVVIAGLGAALYGGGRLALTARRSPRSAVLALTVLTCGALGGVALAGPQLLPAYELLARSCRSLGTLLEPQAVFVDGPHDPARFFRLVLRNGFTDGVPAALALALAPLALLGERRARVALLLVVGLLGLLVSFPEHVPLYGWLRETPLLADFRFPYRYRILADLALAVAAGVGASALGARLVPRVPAARALPLLWVGLWLGTATLPVLRVVPPFVRQAPVARALSDELPGRPRLPTALEGRIYWTANARKLRSPTDLAALQDMEPLSLARLGQLLSYFEVGRPLTVTTLPPRPGVRRRREAVAAPYYGRLELSGPPERAPLLDLLSAVTFVSDDPPAWLSQRYERLSPNGARPAVFHNPHALPRVFRVGAAVPEPEQAGRALARLADPRFDPHRLALLDRPPPALSLRGRRGVPPAEGSARIVEYRPEHVEIETDGRRPAVVVLTDAHYPGWQASVDGRPAALLRADFLFRGVAVPPGRHTIALDYRPRSLRLGLALAALVACAFAVAVWRERRAAAR